MGRDEAVKGELLSCYTGALAVYLDRRGKDWLGALGPGRVFAVRADEDPLYGHPSLGFVHHARPLRCLAGGTLTLQCAADPGEARAEVAREVSRSGAVIVASDTWNLPWNVGVGDRHAPHWIVVDDTDGDRWHVVDVFCAVDELGVQQAWSGWLPVADFARWAMAVSRPGPAAIRDRYALADDGDPVADGPYRWFRLDAPERDAPPGVLAQPGWRMGADALSWLADLIDDPQRRQLVLGHSDDLWVAVRRLHLQRLWNELNGGATPDPERLRMWDSLPIQLRYLTELQARGRPARAGLVSATLRRLAEAEPESELRGGDLL